MPKRRTLTIDEAERAKLKHLRDHDSRPYVRERCAAILKIAGGKSAHQVALAGLLQPRQPDTVYRWLDYYEAEGVTGLTNHRHGGARRGFL